MRTPDWKDQLRAIGKRLEEREATRGPDAHLSQKLPSHGEEVMNHKEKVELQITTGQEVTRQGIRHLHLSQAWKWSEDPFPAFRCELVFGRNKRDKSFLPVKDVVPELRFQVTQAAGVVLFESFDREEAKHYLEQYRQDNRYAYVQFREVPPQLPQGRFRVIKTKEKGTLLVVPGQDKSERALVFVGCKGGFRGWVDVVKEATTAQILKLCRAGSACDSQVEVAALMEKGQEIAFHSYGRRTNDVYQYLWDGQDLQNKRYSKGEWDARMSLHEEHDYEEL